MKSIAWATLALLAASQVQAQGLACVDEYRQAPYDKAAAANADCIQGATPRLELSGADPNDVAVAVLYECRAQRNAWILSTIDCKPALSDASRLIEELSREAAVDQVIEIRAARHTPLKSPK
jgi:hypothetical protein